ncbi:hypothetical protein TNCT1_65970 [Streptomyces sp. 1-11]|nr:hypothetical protein TNCT1_65970 [Streptomyces sp. 1-11]
MAHAVLGPVTGPGSCDASGAQEERGDAHIVLPVLNGRRDVGDGPAAGMQRPGDSGRIRAGLVTAQDSLGADARTASQADRVAVRDGGLGGRHRISKRAGGAQ